MRPALAVVSASVVLASVVLASVACPTGASAQACQGGRTATSEGYCCWPAQRWDGSAQRCAGPPRCPAPLMASGATCVGPDVVVDEPAPDRPDMVRAEGPVDYGSESAAGGASTRAVELSGEIGSGWLSAGQVPPAGSRNPRTEIRSDSVMQAFGVALLVGGYVGALATAALAFSSPSWGAASTCYDGIGASLVVPLGGFVALGVQQNCSFATYRSAGGVSWRAGQANVQASGEGILGVLTSVVQLLGIGLLAGGTLSSTEVTVYGHGLTTLTVSPLLGRSYGARATLRF